MDAGYIIGYSDISIFCYHQNMNNFLPKRAKDIKGPVAIAELRRAHLIIAILAIAFAVMIGFVSAYQIQFDVVLGAVVIVLLFLLAVVSIGTTFALRNRR